LVERWALQAMDIYDLQGLHPALAVIRGVDEFTRISREQQQGCLLDQHKGVLLGFLHGLSGRRLKIESADQTYTNGETLFVPPLLALLATPQQNFQLYKLIIAGLWAQVRFGTCRLLLSVPFAQDQDQPGLLERFQALELLRLEAIIARELPGLHRRRLDLARHLAVPALPVAWQALHRRMQPPGLQAEDALAQARQLLDQIEPYPLNPWQGGLQPEAVVACGEVRMARERQTLRVQLKQMQEELEGHPARPAERDDQAHRFSHRIEQDEERPDDMQVEILLDGKPLPLPEKSRELLSSIMLDLRDIPDDYLEPAGPGEYDPTAGEADAADAVWGGTYHEQGAELYPEWDYQRQHYRRNWCAMREQTVTPVDDDFAVRTLHKYSGLVKQLRRTFEAMRDENRLLKRQSDGDGLDLDALVDALADARDGSEMSDRLFTRMHRAERNIAVVFMVDMSGSTKGWINDAERESLVLLSEALETLGDRYAIYGFSSITRKRCELYHVKRFDEPYDHEVQQRISGIRPKDYTRMGFAIRHLSKLLLQVDARTHILITLSDGKPDDYDNYRGEYGIEDTRRALIEARRDGIHAYCITIDEQARDYLPHLYGPAAFTVVDDVLSLPLKVSDIYRRLTSR